MQEHESYSHTGRQPGADGFSDQAACDLSMRVFERLPNAFFVISVPNYAFVCMNPAALDAVRAGGIENRSDLIGKHPSEVFLDWKDSFLPACEKARLSGEVQTVKDCKFEGAHGTSYWDFVLVLNADEKTGEVTSISAIGTDTTELKESRDELEHRKRLEREWSDIASLPAENPYPVLRIADDGTICYTNIAGVAMLECSVPWVGDKLTEQYLQPVREALETDTVRVLEASCGGRAFSLVFAPVRAKGHVNVYGQDITERKKADEELAASKAELQLIADTMSAAVARCSKDYRYLWASRRYAEWLQRSPGEIAGRPIAEVLGEAGFQTIRPYIERVLTGERVEYEVKVDYLGPGVRWINGIYVPTHDAEGVTDGWVAVVTDITERKKAQEALQEGEERYRLLFQNMSEGFALCEMIWDETGAPIDFRYLQLNRAWEKQTHLSLEDTIGHTVREIIPGIEPYWIETYARVVRTGEPIKYENYVSDLTRWFDVYAFRHSENQFAVLFLDITERKLAGLALEAEQARLRTVLDTLPVGVVIADADGRVTQSNVALDRIWRGRVTLPKNVTGEFPEAWWSESGKPVRHRDRPLGRALRTGKPIIGQLMDVKRFDGTQGTILTSAVPLRNEGGRITGAVSVIQDVTELANLRRDLESSLQRVSVDRKHLAAMESIADVGISNLSIDEVMDLLAERIAHGLESHSCTIFLLDEKSGELVARAAYNVPELCGFHIKADKEFAGEIIRERSTVYIHDAQQDALVVNPHIKRTCVRSLLGTPLLVGGRVTGIVYLDMLEIRKYTEEEVRLFELLAARTALIIENANLYEELVLRQKEVERTLAREIDYSRMLQRALLPVIPSKEEGYSIASMYLPAFTSVEIGGDFIDVFRTAEGKIALLIGDVSGKGIAAASFAASSRNTIHAFTYQLSSPAEALTHANAVLSAIQEPFGLFATVFLAVIDPRTNSLSYCSAGHPPAAICHVDGSAEFLAFANPPIGVFTGLEFNEGRSHLGVNEKVVLYTDGITEARHDYEMFGTEGIERVLKKCGSCSPYELVTILVAEATDWAQGRLRDDTAVLVISRD